MDNNKNVRWISLFPQFGSSAIGAFKAIGNLPLFYLTSVFYWNIEQHLKQYWDEVPFYFVEQKEKFPLNQYLDEGQIDFIIVGYPTAFIRGTLKRLHSKNGYFMKTEQEMLYNALEYMLAETKPKAVLGEFSSAIFNPSGLGILTSLVNIATNHGYAFSVNRTSPEFHGVPQKHGRIIYIFWNSKTVPKPVYIRENPPSVQEFFSQIPSWASHQNDFVTRGKITERFPPYDYVLNRETCSHEEFVANNVQSNSTLTVAQYLSRRNLLQVCAAWCQINHPCSAWEISVESKRFPKSLMVIHEKIQNHLSFFDDTPRFIKSFSPAITVKTAMYLAHPAANRFLNIRELLQLNGFPHDFEMVCAEKNWRSICQAIPTQIMQYYVSQALEFCKGVLEFTPYTFMKIDNTSRCVLSNKFVLSKSGKEDSCQSCHSKHDIRDLQKEVEQILGEGGSSQNLILGEMGENDPYLPTTLPSPFPTVENQETLLEVSLNDIQPTFAVEEEFDVLALLDL